MTMSRQAERKRLKRSLLKEIKCAQFEDETTEIAQKASLLDQDSSEEETSVYDESVGLVEDIPRLDDTFTGNVSPVSPFGCDSTVFARLEDENFSGITPSISPLTDTQQTQSLSDTPSNQEVISGTEESPIQPNTCDQPYLDSSEILDDDSSSDGYNYFDNNGSFGSKGDSVAGVLPSCQDSTFADINTSDLDINISGDIVNWAIKHKITHSALNDLLSILRQHGHSSLPKLAVTLLKTPHNPSSNIVVLGSGDYWYHGILNCFKANFNPSVSSNNEITIDFFVDGISPYNSPSKNVHLWPIAGRIVCKEVEQSKPFVIALWCGSTKEPDCVDEFLNPFVNECLDMMANGFLLNGVKYNLRIRNGIGDGPARAMMKKVNPHNSTKCCERCEVESYREDSTMVFPVDCKCKTRTDESFLNKSDKLYHRGTSPLEKIMGMISQFPLEPLHLIDLGVTKRVLKMLVQRKASSKVYLKPAQLLKIDALIDFLPPFTPSEFGQWKPKGLKYWSSLKGKELKRFVKYDGILIMWLVQKILPEHKKLFDCFLKFSLGIRILSDPDLCLAYADDANVLLREFVKDSVYVFGPRFVVYNVHHLTHLADDCKLHGTLDNFDAYIYESYLGQMGTVLNAPGRPLPQIIARTMEREYHGYTGSKTSCEDQLSLPFFLGPTDGLSGETYGAFKKGEFTIRVSSCNDNCFLTKTRDVVIVQNIVKEDEGCIYIVGQRFIETEAFFQSPLDSTIVNIYKVKTLGSISHWRLSDISRKCYLLPIDLDREALRHRFDKGCVAIPLTHACNL